MATRAYNSPGVTVSESVNPALAPLLANPQIVALVAPASGLQIASERLILIGTTAQTLKYTGVSSSSVAVSIASSGSVVNAGTYIVTQSSDPDATITGDEIYTIARRQQPTASPTVAATGTGALTGTYDYIYTYVNAAGETGASPASSPVSLSNAGTNLSAITVGPSGTSARNVYRRKTSSGGDNLYHLIATINDNTTTALSNEATSDSTAQGNGVTTFGTSQPPTGIADGDTVIVTYNYTNATYYDPTMMDDFDDIVDKYGTPFDSNGNINSALSFAARLMFINGASEILTVAAKTSAQADVDAGLAKLENNPDVRIVITTSGTQSGAASAQAHVSKMNAQGNYRFAIVGIDGSTSAVSADTLRTNSKAVNYEGVRYVDPASFRIINPVTGRPLNVGGQYMAAAIAGMYAGRDVQFPLTRKNVAGFDGINDKRTASDLALDSAAGLLVIQDRGGILQVRHDVTTAIGNVNTGEASVVRAKYEMAARMKATLDQAVIGVVVPQNQAPLMVQGVVTGVLEQLFVEGVINGYSDVKGRTLSDPTTVEIKFQYTPAYPINNISVIFTINTQTGDTTFQLTP